MKFFLSLLLSITLSGCASFKTPTNELRVTEYGAEGNYLSFVSGVIGGVRVVQEGDITACVEYHGTTATVRSDGCPDLK